MQLNLQMFVEDLKRENDLTIKLFEALTDVSLAQQVKEDGRSLGKISWHITMTIPEMMTNAGLEIPCEKDENIVPKTVAEIVAEYKHLSNLLIEEINKKWNDDILEQVIEMYGQKWSYAEIIQGFIRHQIHHRAQMTILMRQAGLVVPGIYGPAKEEWSAYGMPAQD